MLVLVLMLMLMLRKVGTGGQDLQCRIWYDLPAGPELQCVVKPSPLVEIGGSCRSGERSRETLRRHGKERRITVYF